MTNKQLTNLILEGISRGILKTFDEDHKYSIPLNESKSSKLAIKFLKDNGIEDYEKQMKIIGNLKHDVPNLRLGKDKFLLAGLRFEKDDQLEDIMSVLTFDKTLKYIFKEQDQDKYNEDFNGLDLYQIFSKYKEVIQRYLKKDKDRSNSRKFTGNSDYTIVPINNFEQAHQYSKYTSWCVTQKKEYYDTHTVNGRKRFYFCIKKGFENVQPVTNEHTPLDEYGLSMISVLIDNIDGSVDIITTRWNHDNEGENNINLQEPEQLENIINLPFYKTFKPYNLDDYNDVKIEKSVYNAQHLLNIGKSPRDVFDEIDNYQEGIAIVRIGDKYNFIDKQHRIISDEWFYNVEYFSNGFAVVWRFRKYEPHHLPHNHQHQTCNYHYIYNFIDKNGNILSNEWFGMACPFQINDDGKIHAYVVHLDGERDVIDTKGRLKSIDKDFDDIKYDDYIDYDSEFMMFVDKDGNPINKH